MANWYESLAVGVRGGDIFAAVTEDLAGESFSSSLNPGHLIHYEEWFNSPIRDGSDDRIESGMMLQSDIIPTGIRPGWSTNCEDTLVIADAALRAEIACPAPRALGAGADDPRVHPRPARRDAERGRAAADADVPVPPAVLDVARARDGAGMTLRSRSWFEGTNLFAFVHRSWMRAEGFASDVFDGRPVIGICNSWSELTNCNAHLRLVADAVKRGVWEAGGLPLEFPTISLGEPYMKPTTMMFRNLMAMDVEESIRAQPARRRRPPVRLRQDDAGAADGRGERRPAGDHGHRRPDAEGQLARAGDRLGHRRVPLSTTCTARAGSRTRSSPRSRAASPAAPATAW